MTEHTTSKILRTPPGTRGGLSDVETVKTKPVDPLETAVSALVFIAALFTLGYFAIVNWTGTGDSYEYVPTPVELTENERNALEIERKAAEAVRPSTLDNFYDGNFSDSSDPFVSFSGPVMSEDGSGPLPMPNIYGAPSIHLFATEAGGWAVPFAAPVEEAPRTGLQ